MNQKCTDFILVFFAAIPFVAGLLIILSEEAMGILFWFLALFLFSLAINNHCDHKVNTRIDKEVKLHNGFKKQVIKTAVFTYECCKCHRRLELND